MVGAADDVRNIEQRLLLDRLIRRFSLYHAVYIRHEHNAAVCGFHAKLCRDNVLKRHFASLCDAGNAELSQHFLTERLHRFLRKCRQR